VTKAEGNAGNTPFTFRVSLSRAAAQLIRVSYATADGTATVAGNDYDPATGTLTFLPGQTSKLITVKVDGDGVVEPNETFTVNLGPVVGPAVIGRGRGVGTILNDDPPPPPPPSVRISINNESDFERDSGLLPITFKVTLDRPSTRTITVHYATANGTAAAGSDYNATRGTITFAPGQTRRTVTVFVRGDRVKELDETFFVDLSTPTNARIAGGRGRGLIRNDD
jgi:hypothetical protein